MCCNAAAVYCSQIADNWFPTETEAGLKIKPSFTPMRIGASEKFQKTVQYPCCLTSAITSLDNWFGVCVCVGGGGGLPEQWAFINIPVSAQAN